TSWEKFGRSFGIACAAAPLRLLSIVLTRTAIAVYPLTNVGCGNDCAALDHLANFFSPTVVLSVS
ncbi:MAG TPA: hypothetical protein VGZ91_14605, partial [Candidatus Sulfotelmatobacter sp.]|nr:hypothetical protein [Candidatus Sulfotelmatobacter sp.]